MFPEYVKFYYDKLPSAKKSVYMQMYNGLRAHKKQFDIVTDPAAVSQADLGYIFTCLYNDTPSFYYLDLSMYRTARTPTGYTFMKDFLYSEEQIRQFDRSIKNGLRDFRARFIRDGMSDYEKEIAIHDYLVRTVTYDEQSFKNEEQRLRHGEIYNVLGPLLRKKAVCWGIACAFKLICDYCRVKCFVIIGNALPVRAGVSEHAWNVVRLDNENYHVDVTWDIKKKGDISFSYEYLNLDDHMIRLDHTWSDDIYPPCKALTYNYYNKNKLYVRTLDQIPDYIRKRVLAGERYITFKFANDMPEQALLRERITLGLRQTRFQRAVYSMNMNTHNVYLDLGDP